MEANFFLRGWFHNKQGFTVIFHQEFRTFKRREKERERERDRQTERERERERESKDKRKRE